MEKSRVVYFDVLNILAAFSVVFMHCNSAVHVFENTMPWRQTLIVEVLCYWAVPVFFMLSGANLINYRERYTTSEFFKKRMIRIFVPFIIFSLIYAAIYKINPLQIGNREFLNRILNTQIITIFWFFVPMFSVYFAMPVVSLLQDNKRILWYMAGLGFFLNSLLPHIFMYLGLVWNYSLTSLISGGFLIFPILGYLISRTEFSLKKRCVLYSSGIFCVVLRYFLTIHLSVRDGVINYTFFDYLQWHSVIFSIAVFEFFKNSKIIGNIAQKPLAVKVLKNLSSTSFGVYLIHYIVIHCLCQVMDQTTYLWRLAVPFVVYFVSVAVVGLIKKFPVIKHIVP